MAEVTSWIRFLQSHPLWVLGIVVAGTALLLLRAIKSKPADEIDEVLDKMQAETGDLYRKVRPLRPKRGSAQPRNARVAASPTAPPRSTSRGSR